MAFCGWAVTPASNEMLLAFSCKRRGFCPSCAGRRMAQTAAHLVERVIPWVPTRQWVVSVPVPLRYWMAASQDLTAKVHTIIRTTIGQYYVNQAVTRGVARAKVQPGSVTFIQRFGSAINLNLHFHVVFLEGVYLDRTDQGLQAALCHRRAAHRYRHRRRGPEDQSARHPHAAPAGIPGGGPRRRRGHRL